MQQLLQKMGRQEERLRGQEVRLRELRGLAEQQLRVKTGSINEALKPAEEEQWLSNRLMFGDNLATKLMYRGVDAGDGDDDEADDDDAEPVAFPPLEVPLELTLNGNPLERTTSLR